MTATLSMSCSYRGSPNMPTSRMALDEAETAGYSVTDVVL